MTVQMAKSSKNKSLFFNLHDSALDQHVNAASRRSLEIQPHCVTFSCSTTSKAAK